MKNLREFALEAKDDKIAFLPGDVIRGELYFCVEEPIEIKSLKVMLFGEGAGAWLGQSDKEYENTDKDSDGKIKNRVLVDIGLLVSGYAENDDRKTEFHESGRFVYDFEFNIPKNLPCSFKSPIEKDLGYARYCLKAILCRPKKYEKEIKFKIVINELLDPDRPEFTYQPGSYEEKNVVTGCMPSGTISLESYLNQSYYMQGESILINALAENGSPKIMKELYAKLIRRVRCKARFGTSTYTVDTANAHGHRIPAQDRLEWKNHEMKVPAVGPTISGNVEIRVDYIVRVGMYEEMGSEIHLDLPVVIGTVAMKDEGANKEDTEEVEEGLFGRDKNDYGLQLIKADNREKHRDTLRAKVGSYPNLNIDQAEHLYPAKDERSGGGEGFDSTYDISKESSGRWKIDDPLDQEINIAMTDIEGDGDELFHQIGLPEDTVGGKPSSNKNKNKDSIDRSASADGGVRGSRGSINKNMGLKSRSRSSSPPSKQTQRGNRKSLSPSNKKILRESTDSLPEIKGSLKGTEEALGGSMGALARRTDGKAGTSSLGSQKALSRSEGTLFHSKDRLEGNNMMRTGPGKTISADELEGLSKPLRRNTGFMDDNKDATQRRKDTLQASADHLRGSTDAWRPKKDAKKGTDAGSKSGSRGDMMRNKDNLTGSKDNFRESQGDIKGIKRDLDGSKESLQGSKGDIRGGQRNIKSGRDGTERRKEELKGSQGETESIKGDIDRRKGGPKESQQGIKASQGDIKGSKGNLGGSKDDLTRSKGDLTGSNDNLGRSQGDIKGSKGDLDGSKGDIQGSQGDNMGDRDGIERSKGSQGDIKGGIDGSKGGLEESQGGIKGSKGDLNGSNVSMIRSEGEMRNSPDEIKGNKEELDRRKFGEEASTEGNKDELYGSKDKLRENQGGNRKGGLIGSESDINGNQGNRDLKGNEGDMTRTKHDLEGRKGALRQAKDGLTGSQSDIKNRKGNVIGNQGDLKDSKDSTKGSRGDLKGRRSGLKKKKDPYGSKSDLKENKDGLHGSEGDLKDSKCDLNDSKGDMEGSKGDMKGSKDNLKDSKAYLEGSKGDLKNSKSNLKGRSGLKGSEVELQEGNGGLRGSKGDLKGTKGDVNGNSGSMKERQGDLKGSTDILQDLISINGKDAAAASGKDVPTGTLKDDKQPIVKETHQAASQDIQHSDKEEGAFFQALENVDKTEGVPGSPIPSEERESVIVPMEPRRDVYAEMDEEEFLKEFEKFEQEFKAQSPSSKKRGVRDHPHPVEHTEDVGDTGTERWDEKVSLRNPKYGDKHVSPEYMDHEGHPHALMSPIREESDEDSLRNSQKVTRGMGDEYFETLHAANDPKNAGKSKELKQCESASGEDKTPQKEENEKKSVLSPWGIVGMIGRLLGKKKRQDDDASKPEEHIKDETKKDKMNEEKLESKGEKSNELNQGNNFAETPKTKEEQSIRLGDGVGEEKKYGWRDAGTEPDGHVTWTKELGINDDGNIVREGNTNDDTDIDETLPEDEQHSMDKPVDEIDKKLGEDRTEHELKESKGELKGSTEDLLQNLLSISDKDVAAASEKNVATGTVIGNRHPTGEEMYQANSEEVQHSGKNGQDKTESKLVPHGQKSTGAEIGVGTFPKTVISEDSPTLEGDQRIQQSGDPSDEGKKTEENGEENVADTQGSSAGEDNTDQDSLEHADKNRDQSKDSRDDAQLENDSKGDRKQTNESRKDMTKPHELKRKRTKEPAITESKLKKVDKPVDGSSKDKKKGKFDKTSEPTIELEKSDEPLKNTNALVKKGGKWQTAIPSLKNGIACENPNVVALSEEKLTSGNAISNVKDHDHIKSSMKKGDAEKRQIKKCDNKMSPVKEGRSIRVPCGRPGEFTRQSSTSSGDSLFSFHTSSESEGEVANKRTSFPKKNAAKTMSDKPLTAPGKSQSPTKTVSSPETLLEQEKLLSGAKRPDSTKSHPKSGTAVQKHKHLDEILLKTGKSPTKKQRDGKQRDDELAKGKEKQGNGELVHETRAANLGSSDNEHEGKMAAEVTENDAITLFENEQKKDNSPIADVNDDVQQLLSHPSRIMVLSDQPVPSNLKQQQIEDDEGYGTIQRKAKKTNFSERTGRPINTNQGTLRKGARDTSGSPSKRTVSDRPSKWDTSSSPFKRDNSSSSIKQNSSGSRDKHKTSGSPTKQSTITTPFSPQRASAIPKKKLSSEPNKTGLPVKRYRSVRETSSGGESDGLINSERQSDRKISSGRDSDEKISSGRDSDGWARRTKIPSCKLLSTPKKSLNDDTDKIGSPVRRATQERTSKHEPKRSKQQLSRIATPFSPARTLVSQTKKHTDLPLRNSTKERNVAVSVSPCKNNTKVDLINKKTSSLSRSGLSAKKALSKKASNEKNATQGTMKSVPKATGKLNTQSTAPFSHHRTLTPSKIAFGSVAKSNDRSPSYLSSYNAPLNTTPTKTYVLPSKHLHTSPYKQQKRTSCKRPDTMQSILFSTPDTRDEGDTQKEMLQKEEQKINKSERKAIPTIPIRTFTKEPSLKEETKRREEQQEKAHQLKDAAENDADVQREVTEQQPNAIDTEKKVTPLAVTNKQYPVTENLHDPHAQCVERRQLSKEDSNHSIQPLADNTAKQTGQREKTVSSHPTPFTNTDTQTQSGPSTYDKNQSISITDNIQAKADTDIKDVSLVRQALDTSSEYRTEPQQKVESAIDSDESMRGRLKSPSSKQRGRSPRAKSEGDSEKKKEKEKRNIRSLDSKVSPSMTLDKEKAPVKGILKHKTEERQGSYVTPSTGLRKGDIPCNIPSGRETNAPYNHMQEHPLHHTQPDNDYIPTPRPRMAILSEPSYIESRGRILPYVGRIERLDQSRSREDISEEIPDELTLPTTPQKLRSGQPTATKSKEFDFVLIPPYATQCVTLQGPSDDIILELMMEPTNDEDIKVTSKSPIEAIETSAGEITEQQKPVVGQQCIAIETNEVRGKGNMAYEEELFETLILPKVPSQEGTSENTPSSCPENLILPNLPSKANDSYKNGKEDSEPDRTSWHTVLLESAADNDATAYKIDLTLRDGEKDHKIDDKPGIYQHDQTEEVEDFLIRPSTKDAVRVPANYFPVMRSPPSPNKFLKISASDDAKKAKDRNADIPNFMKPTSSSLNRNMVLQQARDQKRSRSNSPEKAVTMPGTTRSRSLSPRINELSEENKQQKHAHKDSLKDTNQSKQESKIPKKSVVTDNSNRKTQSRSPPKVQVKSPRAIARYEIRTESKTPASEKTETDQRSEKASPRTESNGVKRAPSPGKSSHDDKVVIGGGFSFCTSKKPPKKSVKKSAKSKQKQPKSGSSDHSILLRSVNSTQYDRVERTVSKTIDNAEEKRKKLPPVSRPRWKTQSNETSEQQPMMFFKEVETKHHKDSKSLEELMEEELLDRKLKDEMKKNKVPDGGLYKIPSTSCGYLPPKSIAYNIPLSENDFKYSKKKKCEQKKISSADIKLTHTQKKVQDSDSKKAQMYDEVHVNKKTITGESTSIAYIFPFNDDTNASKESPARKDFKMISSDTANSTDLQKSSKGDVNDIKKDGASGSVSYTLSFTSDTESKPQKVSSRKVQVKCDRTKMKPKTDTQSSLNNHSEDVVGVRNLQRYEQLKERRQVIGLQQTEEASAGKALSQSWRVTQEQKNETSDGKLSRSWPSNCKQIEQKQFNEAQYLDTVVIKRIAPKSAVRPLTTSVHQGSMSEAVIERQSKPKSKRPVLESKIPQWYNDLRAEQQYLTVPHRTNSKHTRAGRSKDDSADSFENHEKLLGIVDEHGKVRSNNQLLQVCRGHTSGEDMEEQHSRNRRIYQRKHKRLLHDLELARHSRRSSCPAAIGPREGLIEFSSEMYQDVDGSETGTEYATDDEEFDRIDNFSEEYQSGEDSGDKRISFEISKSAAATASTAHSDTQAYSRSSTKQQTASTEVTHGGFGYEEEIIETYQFIEERPHKPTQLKSVLKQSSWNSEVPVTSEAVQGTNVNIETDSAKSSARSSTDEEAVKTSRDQDFQGSNVLTTSDFTATASEDRVMTDARPVKRSVRISVSNPTKRYLQHLY